MLSSWLTNPYPSAGMLGLRDGSTVAFRFQGFVDGIIYFIVSVLPFFLLYLLGLYVLYRVGRNVYFKIRG